ncbi:outer membrane protein assembly factor [Pseudothauera rhizosphaerae]|uniref:Outer membrane protein assembly factor n=1 Tax=Pseudothauera rhizosphaerae TaxID=2565932 RepID=A0A4S4AIX4_9RHOO|nr:autotransporter assembly complex family protein [Pseudothauera rhizosphaerae]THF59324.1 outer membrane protein assembly factor [Pseudothauera rhizosphaerae]
MAAAGLLWSAAAAARAELEAPEAVRELLQRHVRILQADAVLPEVAADRSAVARRTRREVADLLATEGYFSPRIELRRAGAGPWKLVVEPGERAHVASVRVDFEGDLAGEEGERPARREALRAAWALQPGAPFRQGAWDEAKTGLLDDVSARDYAAARLAASRAEVDPESATVALSVTVDSGPPFRLGPLAVSGLHHLPADLVERHSTLEPGDRYDRDHLLDLQSTLQNAPQFGSVIVDIERDPALADSVPVRVEVSEALPRKAGLGAGYSTNTGYRGELSYSDVNLFKRGWELYSGLRLEQRRQSLYADVFLPPVRARYRDSFGAALERSDLQGLRLTTQAVGVARATSRGNIDTQVALRYQHERRDPDGAESTSANTLSANWTWRRRAVDDLLDPRAGYVLEVQVGGGARAVLSDQDFLRLYGRYVHYQPVRGRDVLILRAELGATLAPSREGVPQDFLFRTGGAQTVRGYAYQSLGVSEGDATVGGRYLAVGSAEYVHWFRPQWGVAAFVDAGDAADIRRDLDPQVGYGLGARWASPAGPLALDLAWGHEDRSLRLHFGIAIAF